MKKQFSIVALTILLVSTTSFAQTKEASLKKWGLETDLVQPFLPEVGIIRITATHTITKTIKKNRGDLLLGIYLRPNVKHDVVEKINEYMGVLGYRQYIGKAFNIEAKLNVGYAWGNKNLIDGKDYETSTVFWEWNMGYKFDFAKKEHHNFYLMPQFGMIGNARGENTVNIGPRGGKSDTFIQGSLVFGINF